MTETIPDLLMETAEDDMVDESREEVFDNPQLHMLDSLFGEKD